MRDNDKMQQIYYYWVALWNIIGHHREVRLGREVSQGIASLELLGIQCLAHGQFDRVNSFQRKGLALSIHRLTVYEKNRDKYNTILCLDTQLK